MTAPSPTLVKRGVRKGNADGQRLGSEPSYWVNATHSSLLSLAQILLCVAASAQERNASSGLTQLLTSSLNTAGSDGVDGHGGVLEVFVGQSLPLFAQNLLGRAQWLARQAAARRHGNSCKAHPQVGAAATERQRQRGAIRRARP